MIDVEKLKKLHEDASSARPDGDGDFSSYIKAEGALSRYLKECVPAILALAEREKRMREALERIMILDRKEGDVDGMYATIARRALGEEKAS